MTGRCFYRLSNTADPEERLEDAALAKALHDVLSSDLTPAAALLSAVEACWGPPDATGRTPLLIDGVRVGEIGLSAGLPDTVRIATLLVEERYRGQGGRVPPDAGARGPRGRGRLRHRAGGVSPPRQGGRRAARALRPARLRGGGGSLRAGLSRDAPTPSRCADARAAPDAEVRLV